MVHQQTVREGKIFVEETGYTELKMVPVLQNTNTKANTNTRYRIGQVRVGTGFANLSKTLIPKKKGHWEQQPLKTPAETFMRVIYPMRTSRKDSWEPIQGKE